MVSGLYERSNGADREELRLDVDGRYPQLVASGTTIASGEIVLHWVAGPLTESLVGGLATWKGPMWKAWSSDSAAMPYNEITLSVSGTKLTATLGGPAGLSTEREYDFLSEFFRSVEFEYDVVDGVTAPLAYQTDTHSDRPGSLAAETLTVDELFRRAGFRVTRTSGDSTIPTSNAGTNGTWSNAELHDAMMAHWSRPTADKALPGWALWTIFADQHDRGPTLGGIMFDGAPEPFDTYDYGIERQGTAVFLNSFISQAPATDLTPAAWVNRMQFWCAVHEMGHAFNLLHAWDKGATGGGFNPWVPEVTGGLHQLTFMNYPYFYNNGSNSEQNTIDFFRAFEFRFTDDELTFLRHAPESFVQMGGDNWGRNHAFEKARESDVPQLELVVRSNKGDAVYEYLEPITLELKLTNVSTQPVLLDGSLLQDGEGAEIVIRKPNRKYRTWEPHVHACYKPTLKVLNPGDSIYGSIFVSSGTNGWDLADPGFYAIQAAIQHGGFDVVSEPLRVRVLPPADRAEEVVAQDLFTRTVGRALAVDGSRFLTKVNDVLEEVVAKFSKRAVATHAAVALALPEVRTFKEVTRSGKRTKVVLHPPTAEGTKLLAPIYTDPVLANRAAATLGHIDFADYGVEFLEESAKHGKQKIAHDGWSTLLTTLRQRKVLDRVVDALRGKAAQAGAAASTAPPAPRVARNRRRRGS